VVYVCIDPVAASRRKGQRDEVKETVPSRHHNRRSDTAATLMTSSSHSNTSGSATTSSSATTTSRAIAGRRASFNTPSVGHPVVASHHAISSSDLAIANAAMVAYGNGSPRSSLTNAGPLTSSAASLSTVGGRYSRPASPSSSSSVAAIANRRPTEQSSHAYSSYTRNNMNGNVASPSSSSSPMSSSNTNTNNNSQSRVQPQSPRTSVSHYTDVAPEVQPSTISSSPFGYYVPSSSSYSSAARARRTSFSEQSNATPLMTISSTSVGNTPSVPGSALAPSSTTSSSVTAIGTGTGNARQLSATRLRSSNSTASVTTSTSMDPSLIYTTNYSNATTNVAGRYAAPSQPQQQQPTMTSSSSTVLSRHGSLNARSVGGASDSVIVSSSVPLFGSNMFG
jgi:hypothetical protein